MISYVFKLSALDIKSSWIFSPFLTPINLNFSLLFIDFARSIIADITRIYIRSLLLNTIGRFFGIGSSPAPVDLTYGTGIPSNPQSVFGSKNAMGNVYGKNGIVPFAKGGTIVRKPTLFPFANGGVGLMAEAGYPEAIMPLKRTKQGKLGVEASGGGGTVVQPVYES